MRPLFQRASAVAVGSVTNVFTDRPWRSKTVRLAFLIIVIGMAFWLYHAYQGTSNPAGASQSSGIRFDHPIPWYVKMSLSYIGGFLLGWTFRRFIMVTFLIVFAIVALLGAAKFAGCDTTKLHDQIKHEAETAKEKAKQERDYLKGFLPSSAAAAVGVFWGFWRRSRGLTQQVVVVPANSGTSPPSSV